MISVLFYPHSGFQLNFTIDFDHPAFAKEYQSCRLIFQRKLLYMKSSEGKNFWFYERSGLLKANNLALVRV